MLEVIDNLFIRGWRCLCDISSNIGADNFPAHKVRPGSLFIKPDVIFFIFNSLSAFCRLCRIPPGHKCKIRTVHCMSTSTLTILIFVDAPPYYRCRDYWKVQKSSLFNHTRGKIDFVQNTIHINCFTKLYLFDYQ